jgi:hypothetical protein
MYCTVLYCPKECLHELRKTREENATLKLWACIWSVPNFAGFDVPTAVVMNIAVFLAVMPYNPYVNRRFRGIYHLHFQD